MLADLVQRVGRAFRNQSQNAALFGFSEVASGFWLADPRALRGRDGDEGGAEPAVLDEAQPDRSKHGACEKEQDASSGRDAKCSVRCSDSVEEQEETELAPPKNSRSASRRGREPPE